VPGRIAPEGVVRPLAPTAASEVAERVAELAPDVVAVSLLHAYADPSHERMLADASRIQAYREGLRRHVKAGDIVFDLGTGTGILSLLGSLSRPKVIYAIEHSPFISIAQDTADRNRVDCIKFVRSNSRDFVPPERGDVIIHEQMGQLIFGENMIENLLDLKARALKPGGKILPGRFRLFVEPVVLKEQYRVPFIWEIPGLEYLYSTSSTDGALLIARFEVGMNTDQALTRVRLSGSVEQRDLPSRGCRRRRPLPGVTTGAEDRPHRADDQRRRKCPGTREHPAEPRNPR